MAYITLSTSISSNTLIQNVTISSLTDGVNEILQQPIPMTKYGSIYTAQLEVPDIYINKTLTYTITIQDLAPEQLEEWMPPDLRIANQYSISGQIFIYSPTVFDYKYCKRMFVLLTGRYDMVANPLEDNYTDVLGQLNLLFNSAQQWLDEQADMHKFIGFIYKELPANQDWIDFKNVRYIKKIFELKEDNTLSPVSFVVTASSMVPYQLGDILTEEQKQTLNLPDIVYDLTHYPTRIVYIPPIDKDRKLLVECYYYSPKLERDSDISFWTMQAPEILVKTAYMKLQEFNNNLEHAQFLRQDVLAYVNELRKDFIAEQWETIPSYNMKLEGNLLWQP